MTLTLQFFVDFVSDHVVSLFFDLLFFVSVSLYYINCALL
jgi:hypothetical protein